MATFTWTGAFDEDLTADANWAGAAEPQGGADNVIVPATAARGMQTNMDGLADTTGWWYIHKGFKYNIGATGNALQLSVAKLTDHGSGETWFKDDAALTGEVQIRKPSGLVHLDGDTITNIRIIKGHVFLDSGLGVVALLDVGHNGNVLNDCRVDIAATGDAVTVLNQWGGTVVSSALISTAYLIGGTLEQDSANLAITTLNQFGGTCKYNSTATMTVAYVRGGTLNLLDNAALKTVTDLWYYPGARVIMDDGDIVTITNPAHVLSEGLSAPMRP